MDTRGSKEEYCSTEYFLAHIFRASKSCLSGRMCPRAGEVAEATQRVKVRSQAIFALGLVFAELLAP